MGIMWGLERAESARAVHHRVVTQHRVAIHTVITVLNKLVEKGLLQREMREDLLHYSPKVSEEEFRSQAARRMVEGILSFGPEAVTASFVDVLAEHDPEQLARLGELIRRRIAEDGEP